MNLEISIPEKLGPLFEPVSAWRVLDSIIALVMFALAGTLLMG